MADRRGLPADFKPTPGEPEIPWESWEVSFSAYTRGRSFHLERMQRRLPPNADAAADQQPALPPAYSDEEKNIDLYMALGQEGQRMFQGTADSSNWNRPHDVVLGICRDLFRTRVNKVIALRDFRARLQNKNESVEEFVSELRSLARTCRFGTVATEDQEIAYVLMINCCDSQTQRNLFASHEESTLAQILAFMKAEESAKKNVKLVRPLERPSEACAAGQIGSITVGIPSSLDRKSTEKKVVAALQVSVVEGNSSRPRQVEFVADSAADVSTITESELRSYFPGESVEPSQMKLKNFDRTRMKKPLGTIKVSAQYRDQPPVVIRLHVVRDSCFSVLGLPELSALNLGIHSIKRTVFLFRITRRWTPFVMSLPRLRLIVSSLQRS